jgi:hypothetical protein
MGQQKFTDLELISTLALHEGNITKTAEALGVTRAAVTKRKNLLPEGALIHSVDDYRKKRADTFADFQRIILQYVTHDKMKKASLNQLGTLFGIFYDKERLEKNLATEHIAHAIQKNLSPDDMKAVKELVTKMTNQKREAVSYDEDD